MYLASFPGHVGSLGTRLHMHCAKTLFCLFVVGFSTGDISMEKCCAYDTMAHNGSSEQKETRSCSREEAIYEN